MIETRKEYYTPGEVAEKMSFSLKTIQNAIQERRIPGQVKLLGRWRIHCTTFDKACISGKF